jgi:uncharacterized protein HemX
VSRPDVAPPSLTATIAGPTRSSTRPEEPTRTVTTSQSPARPTTGSAITTQASSGTASPSAAAPAADTTEGIAWWWWLLAAVLIIGLVVVPLLRRQRRRRTWQGDLEAAEGDVAWFARVLIPELRQSASLEQVVGGRAVASDRLSALEDRLTALEATAGDEDGRTRARTLRDAVRDSRQRLDVLITTGDLDALRRGLDMAGADLETVLSFRT